MKRRVRKHPLHRSLDYRRVEFDRARQLKEGDPLPTLEVAFAEHWEHENQRRPGLNHGFGILQDLMFSRRGTFDDVCRFVIRRRDAAIAATVVQWLGTNVGFSFLTEVMKKAGYRILGPSEVDYEARLWTRELELRNEQAGWLAMVAALKKTGESVTELDRLRALENAARAMRERIEVELS